MTGLELEPHWMWLMAAIVLGIAELIAPGVFLIWLAAAAALTGLATLALGIGLPFQLVLFTLFSIAAVYGGRRWYLSNPVASSDPMLNERTQRLVGRFNAYPILDTVLDVMSSPKLIQWSFTHYFRIADPAFVRERPRGRPAAGTGTGAPASREPVPA